MNLRFPWADILLAEFADVELCTYQTAMLCLPCTGLLCAWSMLVEATETSHFAETDLCVLLALLSFAVRAPGLGNVDLKAPSVFNSIVLEC
jgi:hypothetical protein